MLRDGTRPLFVTGDVTAILLAASVTHANPLLAAIYLVTVLGAASVAGLYKSQLNQALLDSLPRLFRAWVIAVALLVISSQLILGKFVGLYLAAVSGALLLGLRLLATLVVRSMNPIARSRSHSLLTDGGVESRASVSPRRLMPS